VGRREEEEEEEEKKLIFNDRYILQESQVHGNFLSGKTEE
jgi:hypothetical protein